jgi:transposase
MTEARKPTYEELEAEVARLRRENTELRARIDGLLRKVEELERAGKRQASPFRGPEPDAGAAPKPRKKPGRKEGKGKWCNRQPPERVDEVLPASLPECCPDCGKRIEKQRTADQYQIEIPPVTPIVRKFEVEIGQCCGCGKRVQGKHALQSSDALGAAAVQIGPNALALAALLNKKFGGSWERIADLFRRVFNLEVTPSALCRATVERLGERAVEPYEQLVAELRESGVVHADETSWRVDGVNSWLWVFTNGKTTIYTIRQSRGADVAFAVLGENFTGLLGRDGWSVYRKFEQATHQTCLAHLIRRIKGILEEAQRGEARFPRRVLRLLKNALALRDNRGSYTEHGFKVQRGRLVAELHRILRWRCNEFDPNRRLAEHLRNEADAVLTFLFHPEIEATNWPAEQAIRPAVVNRKMSGGNRSDRGARAQARLSSLISTCVKRGLDVLQVFRDLLVGKPPDLAACPGS